MNALSRRVALGWLALTGVACAGQVQRREASITVPKLKGCAGYSPPSTAVGTGVKTIAVRTSFTVDVHGGVIPGSVRTSTSDSPLYSSTERSRALAQAESDALSCRFDPALKSGVAIEFGSFAVFSYEVR